MTQGPKAAFLQTPSDGDLVAELAMGKAGPLAVLYARHASAMLALVHRLTKDRSTALDVVHDVFIDLWERANAYDPSRGSVRTWLLLRAKSRALDHLKAHATSRSVHVDFWNCSNSPFAVTEAQTTERPALGRALEQLSGRQREVLVFGYVRGLSSREIAEHLRIPVGTVRSRTAAAVNQLRQALLS